jgi:hypothetical protein
MNSFFRSSTVSKSRLVPVNGYFLFQDRWFWAGHTVFAGITVFSRMSR